MLLAFDDTDGPDGGCTTHLAFHVLLALPELALTGMPRLVRLNPNVPWKTRGNGAVVLPLGIPKGPQVRVGELRGHEVLAFPDAEPAWPEGPGSEAANQDIVERVWTVLKAQAQPRANPGVALFAEPPPEALYWEAVRGFVEPAAAKEAMSDLGIPHRSTGDGRALVGCLGAAAWAGPASSHEVIAYREPSRMGTKRQVEEAPLKGLDFTGATFHTFDLDANRLACVPHTPDPVLIGLRGRDPERLLEAALRVLPVAVREPIDGWLLWSTNHASGDHVSKVGSLAELPPLGTAEIEATVTALAERRQGGHAFVPLRDGAGEDFFAVAFEPTHAFRDLLSQLLVGDRITVVGGFRDKVVRLEKLRIIAPVPHVVRRNPDCTKCGRRMRSKGPSTGFRCETCKTKVPSTEAVIEEQVRGVDRDWHEPPIMARRHLHRPVGWDAAR